MSQESALEANLSQHDGSLLGKQRDFVLRQRLHAQLLRGGGQITFGDEFILAELYREESQC